MQDVSLPLLSSFGAWALELVGSVVAQWHEGPGIEPASPALKGEFLMPGPPGKSLDFFLCIFLSLFCYVNLVKYYLFRKDPFFIILFKLLSYSFLDFLIEV